MANIIETRRKVNGLLHKGKKSSTKSGAKTNSGRVKGKAPTLSKTPKISKTPYRGGAKAATMPKKGNDKPKIKYI